MREKSALTCRASACSLEPLRINRKREFNSDSIFFLYAKYFLGSPRMISRCSSLSNIGVSHCARTLPSWGYSHSKFVPFFPAKRCPKPPVIQAELLMKHFMVPTTDDQISKGRDAHQDGVLTWLKIWHDLYGGRSTTNNTDSFALKAHTVVPVCTMKHMALELLTAWDVRPLPFTGGLSAMRMNERGR